MEWRRRSGWLRIGWSLLCLVAPLTAQRFSFQSFGLEDGLKNVNVTRILQDREGFLWIGTQNGLFRFDGHRYTEYGLQEGLAPGQIRSLHQSPEGTLWVSSAAGLYRREANRFVEVDLKPAKRPKGMQAVASDQHGRIYVATKMGLLVLKKLPDGSAWSGSLAPTPSVSQQVVMGVIVRANGTVVFGCGASICAMENDKVNVIHEGQTHDAWTFLIENQGGDLYARSQQRVLMQKAGADAFVELRAERPLETSLDPQMEVDLNGRVIIPITGGLAIYDGTSCRFVTRRQGLVGPSISTVYRDHEGAIWLGASGRGLARWIGYGEWETYADSDGLEDEVVLQVLPDKRGGLWVSTQGGLFRGLSRNGTYSFKRVQSVGRVEIPALALEDDGSLWVGTAGKGLLRLDGATGMAARIAVPQLDANTTGTPQTITRINVDPAGRIWFAASTQPGLFAGVNGNRSFVAVDVPVPEAHSDRGLAVKTMPNGDIWYGSDSGLFLRRNGKWRIFTAEDGLAHQAVTAITPGKSGDLWLVYQGPHGLTHAVPKGDTYRFTTIAQANGLPSNQVYFAKFDSRGRMWVGTDRGVAVSDGTGWFPYRREDGLAWDDCDTDAFAATPDGSVWIGTAGGLSRFRDSVAKANPGPPRVVFTTASLSDRAQNLSKNVEVPYWQNNLKVRFSILAFARPSSQRFRYRMGDRPGDWQETTLRELLFPEMPPGSYRLEVQGYDGVRWSTQSAVLTFTILPPWYANRTLLSFLALLLAVGIVWQMRMAERKHHREKDRLELAVAERTSQLREEKDRSERANRLKDQFLANVSHEIRTPMNGILGMTELALDTSLSEEQRDYLDTVKLSANSLLCLLNDILDLSKIEAGYLEIGREEFSVRETVQKAFRTLMGTAAEKQIDLRCFIGENTPDIVSGDASRLRQVLLNLLGNALKFTDRGTVKLTLTSEPAEFGDWILRFEVSDTGIGIPLDQQKVIFEAFRQADGSVTRKFGGTGLGLAISARLVELMGGLIEVESYPGAGSTFRFWIRVKSPHSAAAVQHAPALTSSRPDRPGALKILLAEDNPVNRKLVEMIMGKRGHSVVSVGDGRQAVRRLEHEQFDLVLMDVQMPEMDGLEATRQIRALESALGTRVPIVAMTANAMKGDEASCLAAGMDGYVAKPFEADKLFAVLGRLVRTNPKT